MRAKASGVAVVFLMWAGCAMRGEPEVNPQVASASLEVPVSAVEPVLNAEEAARRVGETVVFRDAIKAVSRSRTEAGVYLSFGAPYPKQVLSVWVPDEVGQQLRGLRIGREVSIRGEVQGSETGPMIRLTQVGQYELEAVDLSILERTDLDGRADSLLFSAAVGQLVQEGDAETLERVGRRLWEKRERTKDGAWGIAMFFEALELPSGASESRFRGLDEVILKWEGLYPESVLAVVARARHHVNLAWRHRGAGYANTVTEAGWAGFREELAKARAVLERNPGAMECPQAYVVMQAVALGQGWSEPEAYRLLREATARTPDYAGFYLSMAWYLLPRWFGEEGDWERFAEEERRRLGGEEGDAMYARIAWAMYGRSERKLFTETDISWETMAAGFDALVRRHPESRFLRNARANFAWRAGDRGRLRAWLAEMGTEPDMAIWVNLENVALAEKFARGE